MTVLERLTKDISTAYTEVPLILGTDLNNLVTAVIADISSRPEWTNQRFFDYYAHESWYSEEWYAKIWDLSIQPIVIEYLNKFKPTAWFKKYYELNLTKE